MKYFCGCSASPEDVINYCPEHNSTAINYDGAWNKILNDTRLTQIRKRISIHDLRMLFDVAAEGLYERGYDAYR